ncbi:unnamed protein product [Linum trigynum]|uniref:Uncharacterized protein n=1 Tax=Linum trigynum TaxID=586398 RepID=A0AAV2DIX6_9ROSI
MCAQRGAVQRCVTFREVIVMHSKAKPCGVGSKRTIYWSERVEMLQLVSEIFYTSLLNDGGAKPQQGPCVLGGGG